MTRGGDLRFVDLLCKCLHFPGLDQAEVGSLGLIFGSPVWMVGTYMCDPSPAVPASSLQAMLYQKAGSEAELGFEPMQ